MTHQHKTPKPVRAKVRKPKKRRLGVSDLRFVEAVPREVADAEIAKDFEDSKLFSDGEGE